jgi:hypothetical protein
MKSTKQLLSDDPATPLVMSWLENNPRKIEVLPCQASHGEVVLVALQVTTRSPLGAVAYATGGIFVDHGWIRVLGAGSPRMSRTLASWNNLPCGAGEAFLPGAMFVADDVIGGMFALDGGALGAKRGNVCYFAPDTLEWEDLELGYTDWLHWAFTGDLEKFYQGSRWLNWRTEVASLSGSHAYSIQPFPWVEGPPIAERFLKAVPMRELRDLQLQMASALHTSS